MNFKFLVGAIFLSTLTLGSAMAETIVLVRSIDLNRHGELKIEAEDNQRGEVGIYQFASSKSEVRRDCIKFLMLSMSNKEKYGISIVPGYGGKGKPRKFNSCRLVGAKDAPQYPDEQFSEEEVDAGAKTDPSEEPDHPEDPAHIPVLDAPIKRLSR